MTVNILYIEDRPDNMLLMKRLLEGDTYHLIEAWTGMEGVGLAESQDIDLILLDINLPDIDGYEVVRRLRASKKTKLAQIPIVAITANALKGDKEKIINAGCDYYIAKPINIRNFMEMMETMTANQI